jgi:zinc/manganese transport system substrate-binding protein
MMKLFLTFFMLIMASPVMANINVFACEPEWGALSQELGGDKLTVFSATTGLQDPHYIQARPSLVAKARRADLLVCTGAGLEAGWLPPLQHKSGNAAIQVGAKGYFMATDYVRLADKPAVLDRSQGHIHAAGNPHIQTSPVYILAVAEKLSERLQTIDHANATFYQERWQDFKTRWQAAMKKWQAEAAPLKGVDIVVQHDNWAYLRQWLGLNQVAVLEPKPGVPPAVKDLNRVMNQLQASPAQMVIIAAYQSSRASDWLVDKTGIHKAVLPFTIGGNEQSKDLFALFDSTISQLLKGLEK